MSYYKTPLLPLIKHLLYMKILEKANTEFWKSLGPSDRSQEE